jgi:hypothetical protein
VSKLPEREDEGGESISKYDGLKSGLTERDEPSYGVGLGVPENSAKRERSVSILGAGDGLRPAAAAAWADAK